MIIYVDASVIQTGNGTKENPFKTIQEAAAKALPGDEVIVAPGLYREAVNPIHAGTTDKRITYRSAIKGQAHITGSEAVKDWKNVEGTVWKAVIPNGIFGDYNPFTTLVSGDWFIATFIAHTGDVYLNEKSMYEVTTLDKVKNPQKSTISWDPDFSVYTWYAEQDEANNQTIIYANFHEKDPNKENVEISVRRNCFYPESEGIGYITLSGFRISQAATQWAPPTAYQEGMVGPHWSKGWIIEDCEIYESKCSGISLGKYLQPENDNKWLKWKYKDGTQTERDCICQASYEGWDKEHIGSHIVRRCEIHDCGQTGIVGHLGGVFSVIEDNHIHHINNKQNLAGAEIGGIKMHAAIDVIFRRNHIHNCTRGLWLDWQAQGTRVTGNLFHDNALPNDFEAGDDAVTSVGEDIFVEVSHGPTLIDHNILLSDRALKIATQGALAALISSSPVISVIWISVTIISGPSSLRIFKASFPDAAVNTSSTPSFFQSIAFFIPMRIIFSSSTISTLYTRPLASCCVLFDFCLIWQMDHDSYSTRIILLVIKTISLPKKKFNPLVYVSHSISKRILVSGELFIHFIYLFLTHSCACI